MSSEQVNTEFSHLMWTNFSGLDISNLRHEISIKHDYYGDAVQWGEAWLKENGWK
ncbi:hypothetical protein [Nocardioides montaniterrae]